MSGSEPERDWVIRFLDDLHAAEAASAEVLAAWIAVCALDGLRGGLRVIAEREAAHAELLAERLGEMGVAPSAILVPGPDDPAAAFAAALAEPGQSGGALQLGQLLAAVLTRSEAPPVERRHKIRVVARK